MGTYVGTNLDEYKSIRTHWIAFYVNVNYVNNSADFDNFDKVNIFQTKLKNS